MPTETISVNNSTNIKEFERTRIRVILFSFMATCDHFKILSGFALDSPVRFAINRHNMAYRRDLCFQSVLLNYAGYLSWISHVHLVGFVWL